MVPVLTGWCWRYDRLAGISPSIVPGAAVQYSQIECSRQLGRLTAEMNEHRLAPNMICTEKGGTAGFVSLWTPGKPEVSLELSLPAVGIVRVMVAQGG